MALQFTYISPSTNTISTPGVFVINVPEGSGAIGVAMMASPNGVVATPSWNAQVYYSISGSNLTLFFSSPAPDGAVVFWQPVSTTESVSSGAHSQSFSSPAEFLLVTPNWNTTVWYSTTGGITTLYFSNPAPSSGGTVSYTSVSNVTSLPQGETGFELPFMSRLFGAFAATNWNATAFWVGNNIVEFSSPAPANASFSWFPIEGMVVPSSVFDRSMCLTPFSSSEMLVNASYYTDDSFVFAAGSLVDYPLSTGNIGYVDCTSDGLFGFLLAPYNEPLIHVPLVGAPSSPISLPTSSALTGMTSIGFTAYTIDSDGGLYSVVGSTVSTLPSVSGSVIPPTRLLTTDGTYLYTMAGSENLLGIYDVVGTSWATESVPLNILNTITGVPTGVIEGSVVAAGQNFISLTSGVSGVSSLAYDAVVLQLLVPSPTLNQITIYDFEEGGWSFAQSVSGNGDPTFIALTPPTAFANQALITNPSNNLVQVIQESLGTWVGSNSLPVSGSPTGIAITPSGFQALVCLPSGNQIGILDNVVGNWAVSSYLPISASPQQIVISTDGTIALVSTLTDGVGGATFLTWDGIDWLISSSVPLANITSHPVVVAIDSQNPLNEYIYLAGGDGTNIYVYAFTKAGTLVGEYTVGSRSGGDVYLNALLVIGTQIFVFDTNGGSNPIDAASIIGNFSLGGAAYDQTVLGLGPSGYWRLGEPSGFIAKDYSGNYSDGVYYNVGLNTGTPIVGTVGGIASFSAAASGYVDIPNTSTFFKTNYALSRSVFTCAFWLEYIGSPTGSLISMTGGTTASPGWSIGLNGSSGLQLRLDTSIDANQTVTLSPSLSGIASHFIVVEISNDAYSFSIDNSSFSSGTFSLGTGIASSEDLLFGNGPLGHGTAMMQSVSIFPRELLQSEVDVLYTSGLGSPTPTPNDVGVVVSDFGVNQITTPTVSGVGAERNAVAWTGLYLLVAGDSIIDEYQNLCPYTLVQTGASTILTSTDQGSSWSSPISLASRSPISTIAVDPNGDIFAITTYDNLFFNLTYPSYTLSDSTPVIVPPPINQFEGVPLGFSKLVYWNSALFTSSSLYGGLLQISGFTQG